MLRTRSLLLLVALLAAAVSMTLPGTSGATYTSASKATSTVTSAADWTPPTVTMTSPGTPVSGTVTLAASASDIGTGIASVELQSLAPGASAWTTVCTTTTSPYSCSWNTKLGADGGWSLRAVATDKAGYSTTSDPVSTTVANNLVVVLADPGDIVRGSVSLPTTLYGTAGATYTVKVEYAVAGSGTWKTICTGLASPYACTWDTTRVASGSYDLRSSATANGTTTTSAVVTDTLVDNTAPTVSMTDPGATLSGTVTLNATAGDADAGVAQVVIQAAAAGTNTWRTLCTIANPPYTCRFDTTQLTAGKWDFRAVATDAAGNVTNSASVINRTVDNTVSSVSMEDPGAYLTGTVTLKASASSTAGVTSVVIQRAPNGTATWTNVCTTSTGPSPYSCAWDTTTVTDGLYDFRAVLTDGAAKVTTSATMASRRVDNTALRGYDVQATNGGATAGKIEANDTFTFTYTDTVKTTSVTSGWDGSALAVQVRIRDGNVAPLGLGNKGDTLDVQRTGGTVNLGSVNLTEDFVKTGKTSVFNATMTATTMTVGTTTRSVITLKLGTLVSGGALRTALTAQAMVWTPSAAVTDNFGTACSAAPVTELGTLDKDF